MKTKRIGYKATDNYKCKELTYEIGKTYEIDNIEMCVCGFHYCPNIKDVLEYYTISKDLKILEIEDIGTERIQKEDKVCTNKIKILREVPIKEHKLFKVDKNGNIIHEKDSDNYGKWYEYDDKGRLIYEKDAYEDEKWYDYEKWYEYDDKGNLIHEKYSDRYEKWYEYDDKGHLIHEKVSNNYEIWYEYDKNGNLIHVKDSNKDKKWYEYDDNGHLIHEKNFDGYEKWYEYDDKGNLIYFNNKKTCYRIKTL